MPWIANTCRCARMLAAFLLLPPVATDVSPASPALATPAASATPAAPGAAPIVQPPAPAAATTSSLAELRRQLAAQLAGERLAAGLPPLRQVAALDQVAERRAQEIGTRGALPGESESLALFGAIQRQMVAAGYRPRLWTESVAVTAGDPAAVVAYWHSLPDRAEALRPEIADLGIGVATYHLVPLYVFLFAGPEAEAWSREAEPLRDLAAVRAALLAAVNAARRDAGSGPVAADARLDAAAQAHAEDMLARSYYSHRSPEGATPRVRVEATGVTASLVAENIAARHLSVPAVMAGWLASAEHRRNILDPRLGSLGSGVAIGTYEHRYQILWVMDLARMGL
jgi:uncharacterized protein YkwD